MADFQSVIMPERIPQIEKAVLHLHLRALFAGAFPIGGAGEGAVFYQNIPAAVKGAFPVKGLIFNELHGIPPYYRDRLHSAFPFVDLVNQIVQTVDLFFSLVDSVQQPLPMGGKQL